MSTEHPQPPIHEAYNPYRRLTNNLNTLAELAEEQFPGCPTSFLATSRYEGQVLFDVIGESDRDPARLVIMGRRHDFSPWEYVNILARPDGIRVATAHQRTRSGTYPFMSEGRLLIDPSHAGIPSRFFRKASQEALVQRVSHVANITTQYLQYRTPEAEHQMLVESRKLIGRAHDLAKTTPHLRVI